MKHFLLKSAALLLALPALCTTNTQAQTLIDGIYYGFSNTGAYVMPKTRTQNTNSYSGKVVIPETVVHNDQTYPVTSIDQYAFQGCKALDAVIIPGTVATINSYSLANNSLKSIVVPDAVTRIWNNAFERDSALESVVIGKGVTTLESQLFRYSPNLSSLTLSEGLTKITGFILQGNQKLTTLKIPSTVTEFGTYTFRDAKGLKHMEIPASVTKMAAGTFYECTALESCDFNASVTDVPIYAFRNCTSLKHVTLSPTITKLNSQSFDGSGIEEFTIPDHVTTLGTSVFQNCKSLKKIDTGDGITKLMGNTFRYDSALVSVRIGKKVTEIASYAFRNNVGLDTLAIPTNVTKLNANILMGCKIKHLVLADTTAALTTTSTSFKDAQILDLYVGRNATYLQSFKYDSLQSLTIGSLVTSIDTASLAAPTKIVEVTSLIQDPTQLVPKFSADVYKNATLTVPTGTKALYQAAEGWKEFFTIQEKTPTAVTDVHVADASATPVARFSIDGRQLDEPQPGINIIKMSDGTAHKVLVR